MITVTKADASVIKSSTITSAYLIHGGLPVSIATYEALGEDMSALSRLDEAELVVAAKRLVSSAMTYNQAPNAINHTEAKQALSDVADLFMQTKEVK